MESLQKPEQAVGDLVDGLLKKWDMTDRIALRELVDQWEEVVGSAFAPYTMPAAIYDGKLVVEVFNAVVLHRIKPVENEVLAKAREIAGDEVWTIQFTAGGRSTSRPDNRRKESD